VWSALGPIEVRVVEGLKDEKGTPIMGCWDPAARLICVRAGMDPTASVQCVAHEWVHSILSDAGTHLPDVDEERVADAVATAIVADLLAHR
jgi:hypothetical protein